MTQPATRMLSFTPLQRYGIAVLGVTFAGLLRFALDPLLEDELPLFFFAVPIIVAGWLGGWGPGLLATVLSTLVGNYFFMAPRGFFFHYQDELNATRSAALIFSGTVFSILFERTRREIKAHLDC